MENKSYNVSINSTCLSCSSVMSVVFSSASRSSALWQIRSCGTFIINVYHNITNNILYDQNYLFLGGLPGWDPLATAQKAKVIAPDNHHCHHHDLHDHHTWQGQTGACQDVQDNRDPRCTDVHPGSTHRQHLATCMRIYIVYKNDTNTLQVQVWVQVMIWPVTGPMLNVDCHETMVFDNVDVDVECW